MNSEIDKITLRRKNYNGGKSSPIKKSTMKETIINSQDLLNLCSLDSLCNLCKQPSYLSNAVILETLEFFYSDFLHNNQILWCIKIILCGFKRDLKFKVYYIVAKNRG